MVLSGTVITRGDASAVVTATGADTALGEIAGSLSSVDVRSTPLQERMDRLANLIAVAAVGLGVLLFGYGVLVGRDLSELFFTLTALAVSAIPEGLPIVLTVALAVGVNRMARRNAIIRRLGVVPTSVVYRRDAGGRLPMAVWGRAKL
jgi:Ca2+-transporting ATPase